MQASIGYLISNLGSKDVSQHLKNHKQAMGD